jgi:hypothetical protein
MWKTSKLTKFEAYKAAHIPRSETQGIGFWKYKCPVSQSGGFEPPYTPSFFFKKWHIDVYVCVVIGKFVCMEGGVRTRQAVHHLTASLSLL